MRPFSLLLLAFSFLFISSSFIPKKSVESDDALSKEERLYLTCKIWGFLKYYHPDVGKGKYNWDEKLQKLLTNTTHLKTYTDYSEYIARWIYYLGPIKPCSSCRKKSDKEQFLKNFDLSWTHDRRFTDELRKSLKNIENNRFQGNHHYIEKGKVGQFTPNNEEPYYDLLWKEENQRLIPLFRYWNYIEYFFPYKYQTEQDWDDVLKEMISKFIRAEKRIDFHLAMLEMVVKIDDTHAGFLTSIIEEMPYFNYLPVKFDVIENQIVVTELIDENKAATADIRVGDVITNVNGQSARDLHESHKKYIWGSNDAAKDRAISYTLFMGIKGSANITIERDGTPKSKTVNLYKYADLSYSPTPTEKWETLPVSIDFNTLGYDSSYYDSTQYTSIGYVNLDKLTGKDVDQMMNQLMDKKAIIFDIRNYPRGTYRKIASYLRPSDTTFAIFTRPDYTYPGKFVWDGESKCGTNNDDYYKGKVILLINEKTQSHAEFTCMALQTAPDVTVIGSQTAGADGNVSKFPIFSRYYTSISGIGVFYPDRTETQRIGIVPDIEMKPSIAGIKSGIDEILETAIKISEESITYDLIEAKLAWEAAMDTIRVDSLQTDTLQMDTTDIYRSDY